MASRMSASYNASLRINDLGFAEDIVADRAVDTVLGEQVDPSFGRNIDQHIESLSAPKSPRTAWVRQNA